MTKDFYDLIFFCALVYLVIDKIRLHGDVNFYKKDAARYSWMRSQKINHEGRPLSAGEFDAMVDYSMATDKAKQE